MSDCKIHIYPLKSECNDGKVRRSCRVERVVSDESVREDILWFEFPEIDQYPDDNDCDAYVLASVMNAMGAGLDMYVHGSVSKELLSNLVEFQGAWNKWLPNVYTIIDIGVDTVRENEMPKEGAVCAFSGGVDATFSVWRHVHGFVGHRSQSIKLCSIVHGFDIPLSNKIAFDVSCEKARLTLKDFNNLDILPISTNARELSNVKWEHVFSCLLVAVLSNLKRLAGTCLLGSSEPYNALVIPWGSSPITDYLLGSGDFKVIHDGASHNRTEKVDVISKWKRGCEQLRVCWQGDEKDKNCGVCEKCLRTQLNFLVSGHNIPSCFPENVNFRKELNKIKFGNAAIVCEWQQIVDYAREHGTWGSEIEMASKVLRRYRMLNYWLPEGSLGRKIVNRVRRHLS